MLGKDMVIKHIKRNTCKAPGSLLKQRLGLQYDVVAIGERIDFAMDENLPGNFLPKPIRIVRFAKIA